MKNGEIERELSQLELSISSDLREQAENLMRKPYQNLKASRETLSEVMAEIKAAEKAAAEIEARLFVFPQYRKIMDRNLSDWKIKLQHLRTELDFLQNDKTIGQRRWEYSVFYNRIDIAERVAKTHMQVASLGDKAIVKDRLNALRSLRRLVNEEYFDVKFVKVTQASEKPAIKSGHAKATQRKVLMAYEISGVQSLSFFDMPRDVRAIFEGGRADIVLRHSRKFVHLVPGQEFTVELYIFNRNPCWDFSPTVRIDSDYIDLVNPMPRTFRFPRGAFCVRYSTTARASQALNGGWVDAAKENKKNDFKYEMVSGFFLPGKLSAYARMDPHLPESKYHLYLPIVKK